MADNITLDAGSGGATLGADDVGGVHYQQVKLVDGTLDSTTAVAVAGGVEAAALRVTIASDSTGVLSVDDNGSTLSIDDGAGSITIDNADITTIAGAVSGSEMQVDVVAALPTGTNTVGNVGLVPQTSGGLSIFRSLDLDESEEEVKGTAGQVFGYYIHNNASAVTYVKFYNATAASVTVGTTTPVLTLPIPANQAANTHSANGIAFSTAITVAATTGVADADTGAPAANDLQINLFYK